MRTVRLGWIVLVVAGCARADDDGVGADDAAGPDDLAGDVAGADAVDTAPPGEDGTDPAADGTDPVDGIVPPADDSRAVYSVYPRGIHPGETGRIRIEMANIGSATWTTAGGYWLDAAGGSDPLAVLGTRQDFGDGISVAGSPTSPGTYTFAVVVQSFTLGTFHSEWRMQHGGVGGFGELVSGDVPVVEDPQLCPDPAPPPLDRMNVVIHIDMGEHKVLDSTPLVWADGGVYCAEIGFTDGRRFCPPRPEGHPDVDICNEQLVGRAPDTGRIGPLWSYNNLPCLDARAEGRCWHHSDNQFLVHVLGPGLARACGRNGVCGEVVVP
ncbi:MAG: hypothetical protein JXB32_12505 [Deltaproteobacteria bacterium]|nr:hypothetical protein [Deltaproteobacteria bacterium]